MFTLKVKNYRGFLNESFDFSKVNVFIGENSSGKSSIFKLLLALKQSTERVTKNNISLIGRYVNLGSYKDIIYNHDEKKDLSFSFVFNKDYYEYFINKYLKNVKLSKSTKEDILFDKYRESVISDIKKSSKINTYVTFTISKDIEDSTSMSVKIINSKIGEITIKHTKDQKNFELGKLPKCLLTFKDKINNKEIKIKDVEFLKNSFITFIQLNSLRKSIEQLNLEKNTENNIFNRIVFLLYSQEYITYTLSKIKFANPNISKPERYYLYEDKEIDAKSNNLKEMIHMISNESISKKIIDKFTKTVLEFGIAEEVRVLGKNIPVRELQVKLNGMWNNITDVGYGVSIQLPIIFQAIISEESNENQFLIIEQPEIHLHPRLHAKFIEILIKLGKNNIYFIETHSEHIIRKIQILVKEKCNNLRSNDISIFYLRNNKDTTFSKSVHKIDENGYLNPSFPSGFFDSSYLLAKELLN
jgi:predicted ATPase